MGCITVQAAAQTPASEEHLRGVYTLRCSGCHGVDGHGLPANGIPDFAEVSRFARSPAGREYLIRVPGVAQAALDDDELAQLMNWIVRRYGEGGGAPFSADEVARYRSAPDAAANARREQLLKP